MKRKMNITFLYFFAIAVIIISTVVAVKIINNSKTAEQAATEVVATAVTEPTTLYPARKTRIVIDAGHGGKVSPGKKYSKIPEKNINLNISKLLAEKLKNLNYEVILTRTDDSTVYPKKRAKNANEKNADIFISIHQNFLKGNSKTNGIETWYSEKKGEYDKALASCLQSALIKSTGAVDRKTHSNENYIVLKNTDMPACIVETGYLTNKNEYCRLIDKNYENKIVDGIIEGIKDFEKSFDPKLLTFNRNKNIAETTKKSENKQENTNGKKTMCLTFDDGPTYNTNDILDILKEKNVKATFFVVGSLAEENPEILKRAEREGHTIGVHCYNHDYYSIYSSVEAYLEDFYKAYNSIKKITGIEPEIFRFPGGSINSYDEDVYQDIICEMTELGFKYFDWNASDEDAAGAKTPAAILSSAISTTGNGDTIVLLAHDAYDKTATVKALPKIINHFSKTHNFKAITSSTKQIKF